MAEQPSNRSSSRQQAFIAVSESRANKAWPGGVDALVSAYREGKTTLKEIQRVVGLHSRTAIRLLNAHGVEARDYKTATEIAHKLNPQWGERIRRTKLSKPFRHTDEISRLAQQRRSAFFAANPDRYGIANTPMSPREKEFSESLASLNVAHKFAAVAMPYCLDFHLSELGIGVEIQKPGRRPNKNRDEHICRALNLKTVIYIPHSYFSAEKRIYLLSLIETISRFPDRLATAIGDARFLMQQNGRADKCWFGFAFQIKWKITPPSAPSSIQSPTEHSQNHPAEAATDQAVA